MVLVQRQRRRQSGHHDHHARRRSGSGLQFANDLDPTINLYDASGNLVATATGNAPDGINESSTGRRLTSGNYCVEIVGSSKTNLGEYTISITGDTGGLAPFTVDLDQPGRRIGHRLPGLDHDRDLQQQRAALEHQRQRFHDRRQRCYRREPCRATTPWSSRFPTTSNGIHNVTISGVEDLQGTVLTTDSFTFETDDVPPVVVSSSIADGAVLSPGPLTEVITFSKPIQPSSANDSDILLYGEVRGVEYTPTSISFDPTDTIMTITYASLPSDAYQFTLLAGPNNFLSDAGVPLQNSFVINFTMPGGHDHRHRPAAGPAAGQPGLRHHDRQCSLDLDRYRHLRPDDRSPADPVGDRDPVTSGMTVTVTLISPTGNVIGTATSATPGAVGRLAGSPELQGGHLRDRDHRWAG